MTRVFKEILHNPLLWLLAFVPIVLAGQKLKPEAHTLLFLLSILISRPTRGPGNLPDGRAMTVRQLITEFQKFRPIPKSIYTPSNAATFNQFIECTSNRAIATLDRSWCGSVKPSKIVFPASPVHVWEANTQFGDNRVRTRIR